MKLLALTLAALLLAPLASAQPPDLPPDLVTYLDNIEAELGVKRFGPTQMGTLEEDEEATVTVAIPNDQDTYIQIACNAFCESIHASARNAADAVIDASEEYSPEPGLIIPAGTGTSVLVKVYMAYCDDFDCQYAVQAFVHAP
jgi:hypothetical protein